MVINAAVTSQNTAAAEQAAANTPCGGPSRCKVCFMCTALLPNVNAAATWPRICSTRHGKTWIVGWSRPKRTRPRSWRERQGDDNEWRWGRTPRCTKRWRAPLTLLWRKSRWCVPVIWTGRFEGYAHVLAKLVLHAGALLDLPAAPCPGTCSA